MAHFTEEEAIERATFDRGYRVKRLRGAQRADGRNWGIWDDVSDHWVEFDR